MNAAAGSCRLFRKPCAFRVLQLGHALTLAEGVLESSAYAPVAAVCSSVLQTRYDIGPLPPPLAPMPSCFPCLQSISGMVSQSGTWNGAR